MISFPPNVNREEELAARWARAGAMFAVTPAEQSPDLEVLLIDTARAARGDSRLFIMAASWLHQYAMMVAKHRLRRLILETLEPEHRPALGLLLDIIGHQLKSDRFNASIKVCADSIAKQGEPLFVAQSQGKALRAIAERNASVISRRWNLWTAEFEIKHDAIRPPLWILQQNPSYQMRAEFKGDLRASILIEIGIDRAAGASEVQLGRRCGATRAAIRAALAGLELAGRIERTGEASRRGAKRGTSLLRF